MAHPKSKTITFLKGKARKSLIRKAEPSLFSKATHVNVPSEKQKPHFFERQNTQISHPKSRTLTSFKGKAHKYLIRKAETSFFQRQNTYMPHPKSRTLTFGKCKSLKCLIRKQNPGPRPWARALGPGSQSRKCASEQGFR